MLFGMLTSLSVQSEPPYCYVPTSKPQPLCFLMLQSEISYREVLTAEPRNVYAANGLGVVLAERGSLDAARDTFSMVQEAAAASGGFVKLPDVWINLANLYLAKQNYASAIQMYLNASKVYNNKNSKVGLGQESCFAVLCCWALLLL